MSFVPTTCTFSCAAQVVAAVNSNGQCVSFLAPQPLTGGTRLPARSLPPGSGRPARGAPDNGAEGSSRYEPLPMGEQANAVRRRNTHARSECRNDRIPRNAAAVVQCDPGR